MSSSWIDVPEIITALTVAAITAAVTLTWHRLTKSRRRFGWSLLYDEPVNQGDPLDNQKNSSQNGSGEENSPDRARQREMWKILYESETRGIGPYEVKNGSLVAIEMRNIGTLPIRESNFDNEKITCQFPGRKVVHFKIRDNDDYRDQVLRDPSGLPVPGQSEQFDLPATALSMGESFKVLVLLESKKGERPQQNKKPEVKGGLGGNPFATYGGLSLRRLWPWIAAGGVVVAAVGVLIGVWTAGSGNTPQAVCATGSLDIEGSTAFSSIMNQVVTGYEQQCPQAHITISAVGSVKGLAALEGGKGGTPVLAMYDGAPGTPPGGAFRSRAVGMVIFSMVGNRSLGTSMFTTGMTADSITNVFDSPDRFGYRLVGRTPASGTREVFTQKLLGQADAAEPSAPSCPAGGAPAPKICLEDSTMQVLTYINQTQDALGYAESDALSYFPNVAVIPVDGQTPTRDNVLNGSYTFDATEHLYTKGTPTGLEADVINFLTSPAESAQLSGNGFISCQDLGTSKVSAVANACGS